jgi:hypothetical protein
VPDSAPARPAAGEIREYLLTQFNQALRRPGLYGGEIALQLLIDALAFADARQPEWNRAQASLRTRGATTSLGVRGAFQRLWGDHGARPDDAMASVYAEMTLPLGWVRLDRTLTRPEYGDLVRVCGPWAQQDRTLTEVLAAYGPPSIWLGGTNPYYPMTLGYAPGPSGLAGADGPDALVCFHFWNRLLPSGADRRAVHDEPVLLAVRGPGPDFAASFAVTPAGAAHRRAAPAAPIRPVIRGAGY